MKITLDLSKLVEEGKITPDEAARLRELAARDTGSLGINILVGFGVVAVSAGIIALAPAPVVGAAVGAVIFALGLALTLMGTEQWALLAQICTVIGALLACAGAIILGGGTGWAFLAATAALALAAVIARSSLLMAAAVLALAASLGARSAYMHASYALAIYEPTLTVVVFSVLAIAAYLVSKRLGADHERLAITAARMSLFLVNLGFWVGSLWGDRLRLLRTLGADAAAGSTAATPVVIPSWAFSIAWAVGLIGIGAWGAMVNRRWVVNVAAVFAAIHFYTQWFERLGASPVSIMLGGLVLLGVALALWTFNRRRTAAA
jgi:hypothetical protein